MPSLSRPYRPFETEARVGRVGVGARRGFEVLVEVLPLSLVRGSAELVNKLDVVRSVGKSCGGRVEPFPESVDEVERLDRVFFAGAFLTGTVFLSASDLVGVALLVAFVGVFFAGAFFAGGGALSSVGDLGVAARLLGALGCAAFLAGGFFAAGLEAGLSDDESSSSGFMRIGVTESPFPLLLIPLNANDVATLSWA